MTAPVEPLSAEPNYYNAEELAAHPLSLDPYPPILPKETAEERDAALFYEAHPEWWIHPLAASETAGDKDRATIRVHKAMAAYAAEIAKHYGAAQREKSNDEIVVEKDSAQSGVLQKLPAKLEARLKCDHCGNPLYEGHYSVLCHKVGCCPDFEVQKLDELLAGAAQRIASQPDLKELDHYRELARQNPYEWRAGACCGDAHMLLESSLEDIKTLGFEVETIEGEHLREIIWHNRRAEAAEAKLAALEAGASAQTENSEEKR